MVNEPPLPPPADAVDVGGAEADWTHAGCSADDGTILVVAAGKQETARVLKIKKTHSEAVLPARGSADAAGYDFVSIEDAVIHPGETVAISTGIAMQIDKGS